MGGARRNIVHPPQRPYQLPQLSKYPGTPLQKMKQQFREIPIRHAKKAPKSRVFLKIQIQHTAVCGQHLPQHQGKRCPPASSHRGIHAQKLCPLHSDLGRPLRFHYCSIAIQHFPQNPLRRLILIRGGEILPLRLTAVRQQHDLLHLQLLQFLRQQIRRNEQQVDGVLSGIGFQRFCRRKRLHLKRQSSLRTEIFCQLSRVHCFFVTYRTDASSPRTHFFCH